MKAMTLKRARLGSRAVVNPLRFWRGVWGPGGCWPGMRGEEEGREEGEGVGRSVRGREGSGERGVRGEGEVSGGEVIDVADRALKQTWPSSPQLWGF